MVFVSYSEKGFKITKENKRTTISNDTLIVFNCYKQKMKSYSSLITACAAANLAIGTLNGEQDT